jgi:hypothetical protein
VDCRANSSVEDFSPRFNGKAIECGREALGMPITFGRQHVVHAFDHETARRKSSSAKLSAPFRFPILQRFGSNVSRTACSGAPSPTFEDQLTSIAAKLVVDEKVQLREGAVLPLMANNRRPACSVRRGGAGWRRSVRRPNLGSRKSGTL